MIHILLFVYGLSNLAYAADVQPENASVPQSTYDLYLAAVSEPNNHAVLRDQSTSLVYQLGRVILSLLCVVFLIVFLAKWLLPKILLRFPVTSGTAIKIIERVALTQQQYVYIIEADHQRLLIGAGSNGVHLIVNLTPSVPVFGDVMQLQRVKECMKDGGAQ